MMYIQMKRGTVLVDYEDYDELSKYRWCNMSGYAKRSHYFGMVDGQKVERTVAMHRQILKLPLFQRSKIQVDHINGNKLDNRKSNLRLCDARQNSWNRKSKNKHGLKGVNQVGSRFQAMIRRNGRMRHIGIFDTPEEAHRAFIEKATELHGEFLYNN